VVVDQVLECSTIYIHMGYYEEKQSLETIVDDEFCGEQKYCRVNPSSDPDDVYI
jgi:hypothetical protein